jgi:hypothetical protein
MLSKATGPCHEVNNIYMQFSTISYSRDPYTPIVSFELEIHDT